MLTCSILRNAKAPECCERPVIIARFEASPNVARFVANANHPARFTAAPAVPHFIGSPIAA